MNKSAVHHLFDTVDAKIKVKVGDGTTICSKIGKIKLRDTSTGESFVFTKVLYLPDCGFNLISEVCLDGRCSITKPGDGTCVVARCSDDKVLMRAKKDSHGLYAYGNLAFIGTGNGLASTAGDWRTKVTLPYGIANGPCRASHQNRQAKPLSEQMQGQPSPDWQEPHCGDDPAYERDAAHEREGERTYAGRRGERCACETWGK